MASSAEDDLIPRSWVERFTTSPPGGSEPAGSPGRSLLTLALVVAAIVAVAAVLHGLSVVATIGVIALVIMLHELGHFTAAKLGRMKVTEYFLGFGPRLWSVRKGETEYGIKAIPAGGYCRIVGMNNLEQVDPADEPRTYRQAGFWRRFAVAVAGSSVHFVLALVAIWSLFAFSHTSKVTTTISAVVPTTPKSPAERAGFRPGDTILSYDGHTATWDGMHTYLKDKAGKPVTFEVRRAGRVLTITATPVDNTTLKDSTGQPIGTDHSGFMGVSPTGANYAVLASVPHAFRSFWDDGVMGTFHALGAIFSPHNLSTLGHQATSPPGSTAINTSEPQQAPARPASVVGIVEIAGQLHGWAEKMGLFAQANVFVGVLNLFPILPFDGGHVVIAVYEAVRSRRGRRYHADVNKMLPYAMATIVLIVFIGISSLYLDIFHPVTLH